MAIYKLLDEFVKNMFKRSTALVIPNTHPLTLWADERAFAVDPTDMVD